MDKSYCTVAEPSAEAPPSEWLLSGYNLRLPWRVAVKVLCVFCFSDSFKHPSILCVCGGDAGVECATAPLWMSEDNLRNQLVLSL